MRKIFSIVLILGMLVCAGTALAGSIEPASEQQTARITMALEPPYSNYSITGAVVIKSKNHVNAYYIGIKFHNSDIGVWALSGSKTYTQPVGIMSINYISYKASKMGYACITKARMCDTDPEVKALEKYLK